MPKNWMVLFHVFSLLAACELPVDLPGDAEGGADRVVFDIDAFTSAGVDLPPGEPYSVDFDSRAPLSIGVEYNRGGVNLLLFSDQDTTFCALEGGYRDPSGAMDLDIPCAEDQQYPGDNRALWGETYAGEPMGTTFRAFRFTRGVDQWLVWVDQVSVDTDDEIRATAGLQVMSLEPAEHDPSSPVRCRI